MKGEGSRTGIFHEAQCGRVQIRDAQTQGEAFSPVHMPGDTPENIPRGADSSRGGLPVRHSALYEGLEIVVDGTVVIHRVPEVLKHFVAFPEVSMIEEVQSEQVTLALGPIVRAKVGACKRDLVSKVPVGMLSRVRILTLLETVGRQGNLT